MEQQAAGPPPQSQLMQSGSLRAKCSRKHGQKESEVDLEKDLGKYKHLLT